MMNPLLTCSQIAKRYFGVPVLRGVNLSLAPGRVLGLVGENGAGKSTLMNILGGVVPADGGAMTLAGEAYAPQTPAEATRRGVAFVHQELNLFTNLSIAENLFLPHLPRRKTMYRKATELLAAVNLNLAPDTLVESLAPGERQLVEIAKALGQDARLMILDEPTTSLTSRETERLFALLAGLRQQGIAVIYISHALADIFRLCDELLVLRDGAVVAAGRTDEFTPEALITLMVGRRLSQLYPPRPRPPSGETVLAAASLTQPGVLENVSFTLQRGEVLGLAGLMGAGRTELARILFGLDPCARGSLRLNGAELRQRSTRERIQLGMALLTENRREEGLLMEAGIADNIALAALAGFSTKGLIASTRLTAAVNEAVAAVQIKGVSHTEQAVRTLSGGNQQKVVLAKWLLQNPSVFILDEPTRGVDVGARAEIYRLINQLTEQGAGVLFISSEIEELIGMCDRLFVMRQGTIAAYFAREEFDRERILSAALKGEAKV
jgi:ABC-type sugar transport system ATPase subunit